MLSTVCTKQEVQRQRPRTACQAKPEPLIFVVEDDTRIRRFICTLLTRTTEASVAEAADPFTALSMARMSARPIDLLISDIDLSSFMNGVDLARKLAITNPSMNVLLLSAAYCPQGDVPAKWRFLPKPFSVQTFLDCVNALCRSVSPTQNVDR
jgi:DNA-binding response OmpR family regulator